MDGDSGSPSPPARRRRLKRLKKAAAESADETSPLVPSPGDSSEPRGVESESGEEFGDADVEFEGGEGESSGDLDIGGSEKKRDRSTGTAAESKDGKERREAKRVLDFGDVDDDFEDGEGLDIEGSEKKMDCEETGRKKKKKKRGRSIGEATESTDEISPLFPPLVDSSEPHGLESSSDFDAVVELGMGEGRRDNNEVDGEFEDGRGEGLRDLNIERLEKKKKKRGGSSDNEKAKSFISNKRREEKERKIYLQQLHVESQKLLRETRDATFKPIPVVHKPISSVLEKIRQRKLEVMKKTVGQNSKCSFIGPNAPFRKVMTDDDLETSSNGKKEASVLEKVMQEQTMPCESNPDDSLGNNGPEEASKGLEDGDSPSRMASDEQPMQDFRAPLDDTQDLFSESQTSEEKEDMSSDQNSCPLEEVFAPSLLAMNLKFDSGPPDDISSDEEDNDKENVVPVPDRADDGYSSPEGDPVKAFVDEEAEEEDDSDNDIRFEENENDDYEDDEELKDLIATECEENPIDNDMRNELHQKWLEQQDATGTDNLMQRLKYGSKLKGSSLFEDDQKEDIPDDEDFYDEAAEHPLKESVARINTRKAKQMIPQMFSDKNDGYLSSDDEEAEKRLTKQRLLDKVEEQSRLISPAEDENSREVFGLIKKLNIMPDTKKKAKPTSILDQTLPGGRTNGFSKSSFLGRKGSHSIPSSHKQGTGTVRSFIFGRDDSNSRSSLSISEDSSDAAMEDDPQTRSVTTKFCSSQFKFSSQITKSTTETSTGPSLFEYLKRSTIQSDAGKQDATVGLTQTVYAAFKIPKKPLRIERRF